MKTYLFACVHNAGRSQMAAAWLEELADFTEARAISAGTQPGPCVHPEVAAAMREVGIELEGRRPQRLTDELGRGVTMLITMAAVTSAPSSPGLDAMTGPFRTPRADRSRTFSDPRRDPAARRGAARP